MPKTWTSREVTALIQKEIEECIASGNPTDSDPESMAITIYEALNDDGLIEFTP